MALYGALSYQGTDNIGDEIQSVAAINRLPRVDRFLNRDNLALDGGDLPQLTSVIMNGWFCQEPENWPPAPNIRPLLISMHLTREEVFSTLGFRAHELMTTGPIANYLRRHGPVGARDLATRNLLNEAGIESYFSGCLTLTIDRPSVERSLDLVVVNDVPHNVLDFVRKSSKKSVFVTSHVGLQEPDIEGRFARAREHLALYARASCVVTGRLHCALPCLAMGTPVILIDVAGDRYRFDGLRDFLHHCEPEAFVSGMVAYSVDAPPANKTTHLPYRYDLLRRVRNFVSSADDLFRPLDFPHPTEEDRQQTFRLLRQIQR